MRVLDRTIPADIEDMKEQYGSGQGRRKAWRSDCVSSQHYSESKKEWVDILELDVIHAIRIIRNKGGQSYVTLE